MVSDHLQISGLGSDWTYALVIITDFTEKVQTLDAHIIWLGTSSDNKLIQAFPVLLVVFDLGNDIAKSTADTALSFILEKLKKERLDYPSRIPGLLRTLTSAHIVEFFPCLSIDYLAEDNGNKGFL